MFALFAWVKLTYNVVNKALIHQGRKITWYISIEERVLVGLISWRFLLGRVSFEEIQVDNDLK